MRRMNILLFAAFTFGIVSAAESQPLQIGVFDQTVVFEKTQEGQKMRAELSLVRDKKRENLENKEIRIKALQEKYDNEKLNMTQDRRAEMERQIEQGLRDLQRMDEDAGREMRNQLKDFQERFQRETYKVVEELGRERGFTLILEKSILFYHANVIDITEDVITKFDEMHPSSP